MFTWSPDFFCLFFVFICKPGKQFCRNHFTKSTDHCWTTWPNVCGHQNISATLVCCYNSQHCDGFNTVRLQELPHSESIFEVHWCCRTWLWVVVMLLGKHFWTDRALCMESLPCRNSCRAIGCALLLNLSLHSVYMKNMQGGCWETFLSLSVYTRIDFFFLFIFNWSPDSSDQPAC